MKKALWLLFTLLILGVVSYWVYRANLEMFRLAGEVRHWNHSWQIAYPVFVSLGTIFVLLLAGGFWGSGWLKKNPVWKRYLSINKWFHLLVWILSILFEPVALWIMISSRWRWVFSGSYSRLFFQAVVVSMIVASSLPVWYLNSNYLPKILQGIRVLLRTIAKGLCKLYEAVLRLDVLLEKLNLNPTRIFWILSLSFGIVLFILIPPFQAPDEEVHFLRAYTISEGAFFAHAYLIPEIVIQVFDTLDYLPHHTDKKVSLKLYEQLWRQPLDLQNWVQIDFSSTSVYSPLVYLPQALGIFLARTFFLPPIALYYAARLLNFLAWLGLSYFAIRLIPSFKAVLLLVLFMPMSFFQAISNSADVVTNGVAFLLVAYIFWLTSDYVEEIKGKNIIGLLILFVLISLVKVPYLLLTALIFIIPFKKFKSRGLYIKR